MTCQLDRTVHCECPDSLRQYPSPWSCAHEDCKHATSLARPQWCLCTEIIQAGWCCGCRPHAHNRKYTAGDGLHWPGKQLDCQFSAICIQIFNTCSPFDTRVNNSDWIQMCKQYTAEEAMHHNTFVTCVWSLNAQLMMPSETLHYMTKWSWEGGHIPVCA